MFQFLTEEKVVLQRDRIFIESYLNPATPKKAYEYLYGAFHVNAFFGRDHEEISDKRKDEMVKEHFSKVLAMGIPELANQIDHPSLEDEELD